MIAVAILCRFGLRLDFAPISLAAVSSSGTPLSEPAAQHGSQVSLILISLVVILTFAKLGGVAAGLILDPVHYQNFREPGEHSIQELLRPISSFLVPVFFVLMGVRVDFKTFADSSILGFALALTFVAILGKQACALAVLEKGLDRISVGIGMIPRGEVGLIFASIGAALMLGGNPVVSRSTYSAVVIMVILTTLVTPPLLKVSLARGDRRNTLREQTRAEARS